jgi:hypothetical protein
MSAVVRAIATTVESRPNAMRPGNSNGRMQNVSRSGDPPPPAHPSLTNPFVRLLYKMMAGISEDCWCARWTGGHEFALWEILHGERPNDSPGVLTSEVLEELRLLSEHAKGWIWTGPDREKFTPQLVSFDEWRSLVTKQRTK